MIRRRIAAALLATFAATAAQAGGSSFDTTGTWQGTISCKTLLNDGSALKLDIPFTLSLLDDAGQVVGEFVPTVTATGFPRGALDGLPVCGNSFADAAKPGKGRLNLPTSPGLLFLAEAGIPVMPIGMDLGAQVSAPNAKGASGKAGGPGVIDSLLISSGYSGACKIKMERTSDVPPPVSSDLVKACEFVRSLTGVVP